MQGTIGRVDIRVVSNIIPVIFERRRVEGQQPEGGHSKVVQIAELLRQAREIANTIPIAIIKRAHVQFVNQRILIP
jgi:hypothetical protein